MNQSSKLYSILLVGVCMSGCFAPPPFFVDKRFTQEERAIIADSANEWSLATEDHAHIDFIWDFEATDGMINHYDDIRVIIRTYSSVPEIQEYKDNDTGMLAKRLWVREPVTGAILNERILVQMDLLDTDESFKHAMMHEFGHHLKILTHVDDRDSIMYPKMATFWNCLTAVDLLAYCKASGPCDRKRLHPCNPGESK